MKQLWLICDLDGTLSDHAHRLCYWGNWDRYHAESHRDRVIRPVAEIVRAFSAAGNHICIMTGRPHKYRHRTEDWLHENIIPFNLLLMRQAGDMRHDAEMKLAWYQTLFLADGHRVNFVIDDRNSVVQMWRHRAHLPCLQPAEGNY